MKSRYLFIGKAKIASDGTPAKDGSSMSLRILCSGYLVRYPLGGQTWHHLQYLIGFRQLGHEVVFFEHFGWENSCYDPSRDEMTSDPRFGIDYIQNIFRKHGLESRCCYLSEDGKAHGMKRDE